MEFLFFVASYLGDLIPFKSLNLHSSPSTVAFRTLTIIKLNTVTVLMHTTSTQSAKAGCKTSPKIKKAYYKAALKHHPNKAGQIAARRDSEETRRLGEEISQQVHNDADRLFKMIGEANAVLSEPDKRSEYDLEEKLRQPRKEAEATSLKNKVRTIEDHMNGKDRT
ncbi:DnaJ domain containing protein [Trema orientale]|uniref:DnaJ domain containing protein n=1 Tax=Trema orientale TaxID=63057 RepID=A0A2P5EYG2_TREOI|nr:DnaJ domain containing protein [Trema orientale]